MKSRTENPSAEELLEDLRELINEAEQVVSNGVSSTSSQVVADLKDRLSAGMEKLNDYYGTAKDKLNDYYGTAKEKVTAGARRTDETIRAHPYESIAIALGVGVLIGALIRRNNNN